MIAEGVAANARLSLTLKAGRSEQAIGQFCNGRCKIEIVRCGSIGI